MIDPIRLQARRRALTMILGLPEVCALGMAVAAPLLQRHVMVTLLAAAVVGGIGAVVRAHWVSLALWIALGGWIAAGVPWPFG